MAYSALQSIILGYYLKGDLSSLFLDIFLYKNKKYQNTLVINLIHHKDTLQAKVYISNHMK